MVKRSINPVWNHTFIYEDVSLQDLSERALELTIWDHDRLASNEFLGTFLNINHVQQMGWKKNLITKHVNKYLILFILCNRWSKILSWQW